MSGDPAISRRAIREELLEDLAASLRSAAVVYRNRVEDASHMRTSGILSTIADKMDLRAVALREEAEEMAR